MSDIIESVLPHGADEGWKYNFEYLSRIKDEEAWLDFPCLEDIETIAHRVEKDVAQVYKQRIAELERELRTLIAATEMPTYVSLTNWEYPQKTYVQSYGGGDCSKHGRYYGTCVCCKNDYKNAQDSANREARYQRDDAIRTAVKAAKAIVKEATNGD